MEGRGRIPERGGAIRQRQLETVGDPLGEGSSRDATESHTAPSGLPATEAGVVYSKLGVIQRKWEKNRLSEYSRQMRFIEEEEKRTVDESGKPGYKFNLAMLFPSIKEIGMSSTNWSLRWFTLPLWSWITERLEKTRDSIPVARSPVDQFVEQCRLALLVYQVMAKEEGLGPLQFRNKGEKKWIENNRKLFEGQIGNFVTFGRRLFFAEVRTSEFLMKEMEFPVRAVPERSILYNSGD